MNPIEVNRSHLQTDRLLTGANEGCELGTSGESDCDDPLTSSHNTSSRPGTLDGKWAANMNAGKGFSSNMHESNKHQNQQLRQKQRKLVQGTLPFGARPTQHRRRHTPPSNFHLNQGDPILLGEPKETCQPMFGNVDNFDLSPMVTGKQPPLRN